MLALRFDKKDTAPLRVLCLGAHSDDIEIGCGGTILKLLQDYPAVEFYWVVFSGNEARAREARTSAQLFLRRAKQKTAVTKNFRDGFFPSVQKEIKEFFEQLKPAFAPDLIFTHFRHDLHQDHRVIWELTWNTFRHHLILEYEIVKYDGDLGQPNFFVPLSQSLSRRKVDYLMKNFPSQHDNHWYAPESFLALMRLRGIESNAPAHYAEAFHCRKLVI